jgi:hypothetical protein
MAKRARQNGRARPRQARGLLVAMARRHGSTTTAMPKRNRKRAKDARRDWRKDWEQD